eukprot:SAG22_NODE_2243_length_2799_cov_3.216296_2_plen_381_part_00
MQLLVLALLAPQAAAWSAGHRDINRAVLRMLNPELQQLLNTTTATWPPNTPGKGANLTSLVGGVWAEAGDTVAGPCAATVTAPCGASAVRDKMALRSYCYAEDSRGQQTLPWPYAIPTCENATGKPPAGWAACIDGPKTNPWLYHYFTETPPQNLGFEGRGGAWYLTHASAALRAGHVSDAALFLSCFAHGMEDRSSPYHNFGGYEAERAAMDQRYNLTATCKKNIKGSSARCFVLFWAPDDGGMDVAVDGYQPLLLGADAASAGMAIGGRMEEISAMSRELTLRPGGYIDEHLKDADWWSDGAVPAAATIAVMGDMAKLSTRLVADVWHTAWAMSKHNASTAPPLPVNNARPATEGEEAVWQAAVDRAAELDRQEPVWL